MTYIEDTTATETQALNRKFDNYEIHGCVERPSGPGYESYVEQCPDDEADYWTLFGHISGEGIQAIGDYATREDAEELYQRITGRRFGGHDENGATARLTHAKEELLEALTNLWGVCETNGYEVPMGYRNQVFAAIAKAKGRAE